jgi:predicted HTH transcriptional regulator
MTQTMKMTKKYWEGAAYDEQRFRKLKTRVAQGEGLHLEFKKNTSNPQQVIRELIAFANTKGGTLLIGVSDQGTIPGVMHPDEELLPVIKLLKNRCRPFLKFKQEIIVTPKEKFVISLTVPSSKRKPHAFFETRNQKHAYFRIDDKTIRGSEELAQITFLKSRKQSVAFTYSEYEEQLMKYLQTHESISLHGFAKLTGLNLNQASTRLVKLVAANVLNIVPQEIEDRYVVGF